MRLYRTAGMWNTLSCCMNTSRTGGQRGGGETSAGECTGYSQNIEGRMVPLSEPAEKRARFSALDRQMSLFAPKCRIFQQLV